MNGTLSSIKAQGTVGGQPSFGGPCPHCAAAALPGVLVELCGKTGICLCGLESALCVPNSVVGNWAAEGWAGDAVGDLVLYFCGSQPDGARFVV